MHIGIIGGVGPQAGLDFLQKIITNTKAVSDQDHLNCILISCPSLIPDRTEYLLYGQVENPAVGMFECARRLYAAGARRAVVVCNTAHADRIFTPFRAKVAELLPGLGIVNMLETCANHVKTSLHVHALGLLATKGSHQSRVFHEYFRDEDGFQLIEPAIAEQEQVHEAIYNEQYGIKANPRHVTSQAKECIHRAACRLIDRGAEAIVLGCTEIPLATQNSHFPVPVIDPGEITARHLVNGFR